MADEHTEEPRTRDEEFVVESLEKWTDRYVANGLPFHDVRDLKDRLATWEEWPNVFGEFGDRYVELGEAAEERGDELTAGRYFIQGALFYHFGSHVWHEDESVRRRNYGIAVDLFERGGPYLDPPLSYRRAPYPEGGFSVPYHVRVPGSGQRDGEEAPVAVLLPGLDSNKEEQFARQAAFLDRGLAVVAVDGAAQGETWDDQAMTPAYYELISAVIDDLEERAPAGIDTSRIGVFGMSMGGFYAPHTAANDDRIDACIGVSGPFTAGPVSKYEFDVLKEQFQWACKADTMVETDEITERLTLRDDIGNLTAPTLIVVGERDPIIKPAETERIARRAPNVEYRSYPHGTHGCSNLVTRVRPYFADWLRANVS